MDSRHGRRPLATPNGAPTRIRNNDFLFEADDPRGLECPLGSHIRRMNPRDAIRRVA